MDLPAWVDVGKIGGLGVLILSVTQYFKSLIPEKWIKIFAIVIGILLSIVAECCIGGQINWVKTIFNGFLAAILADTGYQFLSGKGGSNFQLPGK